MTMKSCMENDCKTSSLKAIHEIARTASEKGRPGYLLAGRALLVEGATPLRGQA